MNPETSILDLLGGKSGWLPTAITWLALAQAALKLFNAKLQTWWTARLVEAVASPGDDDDQFWQSFLAHPAYRRAQFLLDLLLRLKLPVLADYQAALESKHDLLTVAPE